MSTEPKPGVIGSLPRTRPHRRSDKRAASPAGAPPVDSQSAAEPDVVKAPAKPGRAASKPVRAATKPVRTATKPKRAATKPTRPAASAGPARAATSAKPTAKPRRPPAAAKAPSAPKLRPQAPRQPAPADIAPADTAPAETSHGALETAVQAAAELAEIGLHASARALRRAVSRLPRP